MNAAFVEYGTQTDSPVPLDVLSSLSVRAMLFPRIEAAAKPQQNRPYAWVEGRVHAAPYQILAYLRDYQTQLIEVQPKGYFKDVEIEAGGVGAGTVYHATIALNGMILNRLVAVSEPGRNTLVETDIYTGMRTTFTVRECFDATYLRISTEIPGEVQAEQISASLPSAALVRLLNLAELVMAQRYFA